MRTFILLLLFCLAIGVHAALGIHFLPASAYADDPGFYPKDFAGSPLEEEKKEKFVKQPKTGARSSRATSSAPDGLAEGWEVGDAEGDASSSSSAGILPDIDDPSAIPIGAIDGVVNFVNVAHAKEVVSRIVAAAEGHQLHFRKLYVIGDADPVLRLFDLRHRSAFMGAVTRTVRVKKPPKDLPINGSPSWVFYTTKGRYIAEGMDALEELTTVSGKLLWPNSAGAGPQPQTGNGKEMNSQATKERLQALVNSLQHPPPSKKRKH